MEVIVKELKFENLNQVHFQVDKKIEYIIEKGDNSYCLLMHLKSKSDKIVIFSNGAVDPNKSTPPVYMRSSWSDEVDASTIFLDDSTLHGTSMRLGWGQGKNGTFHLEEMSEVLQKIFEIIDIDYKDLYFYGSSAGGFMSLYFSILLNESTAIVNNPQTKVLNYLAPYVNRMLNHSYDLSSSTEMKDDLLYRLDIVEAIKHYNNVPKEVYYFQNYNCDSDIEGHIRPFLEDLKNNKIEIRGMKLINYFNHRLGHNPISKPETLKIINMILKGELNFRI